MFSTMIENLGEQAMAGNPMLRDYHYSQEDVAAAPAKAITVLQALSTQLQRQNAIGSRYFIGDSLSALDIYWACFSQMLDALPAEVNPMPDFMRNVWGQVSRPLQQAGYELDKALLDHPDFIFPNHLQWPLDF